MEHVPKKFFLTKGAGTGQTPLLSLEAALQEAKISPYNLVKVSSIIPPNCQEISKEEGLNQLHKGEIIYTVLSENRTKKHNQKISCALGIARPKEKSLQGYICEHHDKNSTRIETGKFAEKCAISMLGNVAGLNIQNIDTVKKKPEIQNIISDSKNVSIEANLTTNAKYLTVIAAVVFIL